MSIRLNICTTTHLQDNNQHEHIKYKHVCRFPGHSQLFVKAPGKAHGPRNMIYHLVTTKYFDDFGHYILS